MLQSLKQLFMFSEMICTVLTDVVEYRSPEIWELLSLST